MSPTEWWWLALGLAAVVVVVVALLLGLIIAAARSVDRHAHEIWTTGKQIAGNTVSIWMLEPTIAHLERIVEAAGSIDTTARRIDEKLTALARTRESSP